MLVYSDGESSVGDTGSILPLLDDRLGGCSDDEIGPDAFELPRHTAVYMANNVDSARTAAAKNTTAAGTVAGTGTSAPAPGVADSSKTPAQSLAKLMTALGTLLGTPVIAENLAERNAEVMKLREQMAKIQEDIDPENIRLAEIQASIHNETERLKAEALHLSLCQSASDLVHQRRHQTRLPPGFMGTPCLEHLRGHPPQVREQICQMGHLSYPN